MQTASIPRSKQKETVKVSTVNKKNKFKAGSLKSHVNNWRKITSDPWVLQTIKGYKIEFSKKPFQKFIPRKRNSKFSMKETELIDNEICELLKKKAIAPSAVEKDQFISEIFLVKKKNGKFRPVINLKNLNKFIQYHHFKQENLDLVLNSVGKNYFFTSLDMSDAYFSIPIEKSYRKYLKFYWKGNLYEFCALPFGISSAPRVFTKVVKVIFSQIRSFGISSFFYIDDSFFQDPSYNSCLAYTNKVYDFIESLGFSINDEKSVIIPCQRITFLGYIIDSVQFKVYLPEDKIDKIVKLSEFCLRKKVVKMKIVAQLIGLYNSARYGILLAPLFHRYLDVDKTKSLSTANNDYDSDMCLSTEGRNEILWWLQNIHKMNGKPIRHEEETFYLQTDASLLGWGAVCGETNTQGRWSSQESLLHINVLELKAIYFALKSLCTAFQNIHIVKTDSSTAVAYINNMGGSVTTLLEIVKEIWLWCSDKGIFISAVHIPGKDNIGPDNLSRIFNDTSEWKLKENIFNQVCLHFFTPSIDLFASRINNQLLKYVSWFPDPDAYASDAFSFSWHSFEPYIFPPFSLLARILQKLEDDQVRKAIIIVPFWPTQSWFPKILKMLIDFPVVLPLCKDLLRLPYSQEFHPMNKRKMFLTACLVSGITLFQKGFHTGLQESFQTLGENQQINSTVFAGESGTFGVYQNKLIQLHRLQWT